MYTTSATQFSDAFKKELDTGERFGYTRRVCNDFLSPRVTNKAVFVHHYQKYKQSEQMNKKTSQDSEMFQPNSNSIGNISLPFQHKFEVQKQNQDINSIG